MTVIAITCPRCAREGWKHETGRGMVPCFLCHAWGTVEVVAEWAVEAVRA